MKRFVKGICLAALIATAPALADAPADKPALKAGDRWVYRITDLWKNEETETYEYRVAAVAGSQAELDRTTLKSKGGQAGGPPARRKADIAHGAISDARFLDGRFEPLAFPLETGKAWEYEYRYKSAQGGEGSQRRKVRVESWEDVTVPAGTFRAIKVVHEGSWSRIDGSSLSGRVSEAYWYAPQARRYVKREYTDYTQSGKTWTQIRDELVEFALTK